MALMPLLAGIIISPKQWTLFFLALAWISGFLLFSVAEKYIKARRRARYYKATRTYAIATGAFGFATLMLAPHLLWWALAYAPLMGYWLWSVTKRHERNLSVRLSTIVASSLILPVAESISTPETPFSNPRAWLLAALLCVYFALTVPYVKTLIRERGQTAWIVGSGVAHVVALAAVATLFYFDVISVWHLITWVVVVVRAIALPYMASKRGKPFKPTKIGILETVISIFVFATLPWGF